MEYQEGDKVICVSKKPTKSVINAYGYDLSHASYDKSLTIGSVYTVLGTGYSCENIKISHSTSGLDDPQHPWYYVNEENIMLLSECRKEKIKKLNSI